MHAAHNLMISSVSFFTVYGWWLPLTVVSAVILVAVLLHRKRLRQTKERLRHEIDDLQKSIDDIRDVKETFDSFFAHSPALMSIFDERGVYHDVNAAVSKIMDRPKEDIVGNSFHDMLPSPLADTFMDRLDELSEQNDALVVEDEIPTGDDDRTYESVIFPIKTQDQTRLFGCIAVDITQHKRTEQKLRRSRKRFELAVRGSNDGLWDWDLRTDDLYLSPRWKQQLGYEEDELENKFSTFEDLIHPDDRPEVMEHVENYLNGEEQKFKFEFRMVHKDGSVKWILARGEAYRDENGLPYRMAGSHTDITERKQNEQTLEALNDYLTQQTQLANRMAAEARSANRVKSKFLANMSHEIRTPLNGVIGMTRLLQDTDLSARQKHYVKTALSSGERLLDLVNDILDFSKLEKGDLEPEEEPFDLTELMDDFATSMVFRCEKKGLDFVYGIEPEVPSKLIGDPARLRQILTNLVSNAIKFTDQGKVTTRAYLDEEQDDSVRLRFSVSDTGIGIPDDRQEELFEDFRQIDGSSTREYGGAGLGLAIVKQIVEAMGGTIDFNSTQGEGTDFWFTVSLEKQDDPSQTSSGASSDTLADHKASNQPSARILLAEDDQTNRQVAMGILNGMGFSADPVENGEEAIEALKKTDYDLVLMDIQMPEMDGYEATRQIRNGAEELLTNEVPIIALTAHAMDGDENACLEAGMNDYLSKPIDPEQLSSTLEIWLPETKSDTNGKESRDSNIFDMDSFLNRLGGNEELAMRIIRSFLTDIPDKIDALEHAIETQDIESVERKAHYIKGAAGTVGGNKMQEAAREIEQMASEHETDDLGSRKHNIRNEFSDLRRVLDDYLT